MKIQEIKKLSFCSVFIFLDVMIALGICEAWVRCFVPVKNICYFVDEKIGIRYCPNQRFYGHVEDGYSNIAITNSLGCHDLDRTKTKQNGVFRIHFYGDSMIAGMGVQIENTIPSLFEKYLSSGGLPLELEVSNMAAGTESTCGQIVTYQEIGVNFDPDIVICYFMGDFTDNVLKLSGNRHAPYFKLDENKEFVYLAPIPKDTMTFLSKFKRKWCMSYRLAANKLVESKCYYNYTVLRKKVGYYLSGRWNNDRSGKQRSYEEVRKDVYVNESLPLTMALIAHFRDEVEKSGARFVLADGRPFNEPVSNVYTNEDLENYCKSNEILYVPVHKIYSEIKSSKHSKLYFFVDGHPNQAGNERISKFLSEKIKIILTEKNLLEANSGTSISWVQNTGPLPKQSPRR